MDITAPACCMILYNLDINMLVSIVMGIGHIFKIDDHSDRESDAQFVHLQLKWRIKLTV